MTWPIHYRYLGDKVCGQQLMAYTTRGSNYCCNQSNPVLQIFYLTLLSVSYYLYSREVFGLLPLPYAPTWHQ